MCDHVKRFCYFLSDCLLYCSFYIFFQSENITVNFCIYECYGANSYLPLAWTGIEFLYLIFLQVTALVLAIANRKVKIEVLNDFKEMSIIVYTISVMFIPLFAITYGVSSYTTISEIFFSGAIMLATTVFLFFTFVPKVSCGSAYFFE